MPKENFENMLSRYAEMIVKVGLNLQSGQRLFIASEMNTAPLVRNVAAKAYQNGCPLVTVIWDDEELKKIRHEHAPRNSFDEYPDWVTRGILEVVQRGDAYLSITGTDPDLLDGYDPDLIARELKARARHFKPASKFITAGGVQWTVICPPTPKWAAKIFPEYPIIEAEENLWDVMFKLCRLDNDNPIGVWKSHLSGLKKRGKYMSDKQFESIHFRGPGSDLMVGMPENHIWSGGGSKTQGGIDFTPNLPTEEIFSLPHKDKVEGTIRSTKPLNYFGNLIEDFSLTFSKGRVVDIKAKKGEETLRKMLESDEGARQLGEVALVPHHSPISESGLIFYNTLYDENAACHLALGSAYKGNIQGGVEMSSEELAAAGVNESLIHVDFMIGSEEVTIHGVTKDGTKSPIMRDGDWAFEV
ncbi:MAG: aminopeptidase [Anaerolineae bacterium]|nr:aminopeptidase [Anaerolineae bacterium]